jgi:prephenate dehydrogenase
MIKKKIPEIVEISRTITVIGLGLIGGSICKSLCNKHEVFGLDFSDDVLKKALNWNCIRGIGNISKADIVFVATPPKTVFDILKTTIPLMKKGAVIADVCGVKEVFASEIANLKNTAPDLAEIMEEKNISYIGCHPMAGKEKFGFDYSDDTLFVGKDFIITENGKTNPKAVELIEELAKDMGFTKITKCTPEHHDKVIAYTSQLAHIVSSCYVKSEMLPYVEGYCGGSFQDMTRVATLDKEMWADLFLMNRENIVAETTQLIKNLTHFLVILKTGNKKEIENSFANKAEIPEKF